MSARALSAVELAKGWQPWGALVPFLGIAFVASTVISLTAVLQYAGLVDAKENPIGLIGFISFLLFPFAALGVVVLGWVCLVERRPLAAIGLGGAHRTPDISVRPPPRYGDGNGNRRRNLDCGRFPHGRLRACFLLTDLPRKYRHPSGLLRAAVQHGRTSLPRLDAFRYHGQVRRRIGSRALVVSLQSSTLRFSCELDLRNERVSLCGVRLLLGHPHRQRLGCHGLARRMELAIGCWVRAARDSAGHPRAGSVSETYACWARLSDRWNPRSRR